MGILQNITKGKKSGAPATGGPLSPASAGSSRSAPTSPAVPPPADAKLGPGNPVKPRSTVPATKGSKGAKKPPGGSKAVGKRRRKGAATSPKERVASAAAPLHDRRRRLVGARETTLRDLGGLMLEMYKRNRFREELLLDKCEEVLAIEVEIAHVDQRLFQLAPPNAAGMRPIGRCECGAPIHPGQNFCGVCGRSFATLTQSKACVRCGSGLRPSDQFCATCGTEAPDALQMLEAPLPGSTPMIDASSIASSAVAETVIIAAPADLSTPMDTPSLDASAPTPAPLPPPSAAPSPSTSEPIAGPEPLSGAPAMPAPEPVMAQPAAAAAVPDPPLPPNIPALEVVAQLAPSTAPEGFDWSAPPPAIDTAMDTAIDAMSPSPTDPETPFAGFPMTATVPPPPIVDPMDIPLPAEPVGGSVVEPAMSAPAAGHDAGAAPAPVAAPATPPAEDAKAAKAAAKANAAQEKERAKQAKARAKAKAKAARDNRKRGGDE